VQTAALQNIYGHNYQYEIENYQ